MEVVAGVVKEAIEVVVVVVVVVGVVAVGSGASLYIIVFRIC